MTTQRDATHTVEMIECGVTVGWATPDEARRLLDEQDEDDGAPVGDGALGAIWPEAQ